MTSRITRDRVGRFAKQYTLHDKIILFLCFCTALIGLMLWTDIQAKETGAAETRNREQWLKDQGFICGTGVRGLRPCEEVDREAYAAAPIEQKIRIKAREYGVNETRAVKIAFCESRFDPKAEHHISTASGVFQFTRPTWSDGIKWRRLDWKLSDRFDADKNIDMAMWFMKRGEWKRWACDDLIK